MEEQSSISLESAAELASGEKIISELHKLTEANKSIESVLYGPSKVLENFNEIFPDLRVTNDIGTITDDDFSKWETGNNNVAIELDKEPEKASTKGYDVYVGGPAAICSAALHANSGENTKNILYAHDGSRGTSNWKGSASICHIRDCIPLYYWPENHGLYVLYVTIRHMMEKFLTPTSYMKSVCEDPNWNKIRFSITNFVKEPPLLFFFAKNFYHAMKDVGFHMKKPAPEKRYNTTIYATTHHAHLNYDILRTFKTKRSMMITSNERTRSLNMYMGDPKDVPIYTKNSDHISYLATGDRLKHRYLKATEIEARGYSMKNVGAASEYPLDGYYPPDVDQMMEDMIRNEGGEVIGNMMLQKIMVKPIENGDTKVTKIVWKDSSTGEHKITPVNSLQLSLGPSMKEMTVKSVKEPTLSSLALNIANMFKKENIMKRMMLASGVTMVFVVKVDKSVVTEAKMGRFRDYSGGSNKHIVRLAEREVIIDGKPYQYFAMQCTGGGQFPNKNIHAEVALNTFQANMVKWLGLEDDGIEYDIVQTRSCARGLSAQNCFRFAAPASNMVMVYGLGGVGMTTMFPNGLLMQAILGLRQQLARGEINGKEFKEKLRTSEFDHIPYWEMPNPFRRNYAQFFDNAKDPRVAAKRLGITGASVLQEKKVHAREGRHNVPSPLQLHQKPYLFSLKNAQHIRTFRKFFSK